MRLAIIIILSALLFVGGCSGVSFVSQKRTDLYSAEFLTEINNIKSIYKQGDKEKAQILLEAMDKRPLKELERALKDNLLGVILFSAKDYEKAIIVFQNVLPLSQKDVLLYSQIHLNLGASYYRLGMAEKAFSYLKSINHKAFGEKEGQEFYQLKYKVARELGDQQEATKSLVFFMSRHTSINSLKADPLFEQLLSGYFQIEQRERLRLLESFEHEKFIVTGYLGYLDAEKIYYAGDKDDAIDLMDWIRDRYGDFPELGQLITNFQYRIENYSKLNQSAIGIVLPLSGKKRVFGERVLKGIDIALKKFKARIENTHHINPKVYIEDSQGSGIVGSYKIRDLIEKHNVSTIIGGLFSNEAEKQYMEAKKHGAFFVSLSQIFLPKEQKDHLLLEIPGSVESQIAQLFSEAFLNNFGRRAAIIYPKSPRGKAYLEEFWRKSRLHSVQIVGVHPYEKNKTDYREPVKKLLGLKYTRERKEELDILKDIHSLEKKGSLRRIQNLRPQIDFDWVFVPAIPNEALQILPSFTYYDAFKLKLIGGPSWRSRKLSEESHKLGTVYFVGELLSKKKSKFHKSFVNIYKKRPKLLEMRAYDALSMVLKVLSQEEFKGRDQLDRYLRGLSEMQGITGRWQLTDAVWVKRMTPLQLKRGRTEQIFKTVEVEKI